MNPKENRNTRNWRNRWEPYPFGHAIKVTLDEEGNIKWHFAKEGE